jgi:hypothetical protein
MKVKKHMKVKKNKTKERIGKNWKKLKIIDETIII